MPKILVKFGVAVIKEVLFAEGMDSLTVGRKPDNDVVLDNPAISGHHLKIVKENNKFFVEDLNSTNGTFLNSQRILKAELHDQNIIHLSPSASPAMTYTILFYNEFDRSAVSAEPKETANTEDTLIIDAAKQKELLEQLSRQKSAAPAAEAAPAVEKIGVLKIVDGIVDKQTIEFELSRLVTYIGRGDQCLIKIAGFFVPEVAAAINRRPEGYKIIAVKEKYPKLNGQPLQAEQLLAEGDTIIAGRTKMVFFLKEKTIG